MRLRIILTAMPVIAVGLTKLSLVIFPSHPVIQQIRPYIDPKNIEPEPTKVEKIESSVTVPTIRQLKVVKVHIDQLQPEKDLSQKQAIEIRSDLAQNTLHGSIKTIFNAQNEPILRVKLRKNDYLGGIRTFSLRKVDPTLMQKLILIRGFATSLGLVVPKIEISSFALNGEEKGLMLLEEEPGKELLERNQRRESFIVNYQTTAQNASSAINLKKDDKRQKNLRLLKNLSQISGVFDKQQQSQSMLYDIKQLSKYATIIELASQIGLEQDGDPYIYYNPVFSKLEPLITFRKFTLASSQVADSTKQNLKDQIWAKPFSSAILQENYESQMDYIKSHKKEIFAELSRYLDPLHKELVLTTNNSVIESDLNEIENHILNFTESNTKENLKSLANECKHIPIGVNKSNLLTLQCRSPQFPYFAHYNAGKRLITIPTGSWVINKTILIPYTYSLEVEQGAQLTFSEQAAIVSYGPVNINGTKEQPVTMKASNTSWPGLLIFQANRFSNISHTTFSDLGSFKKLETAITGGLTVYDSSISIRHSRFIGSHEEDMVNLILTHFSIEDSYFSQSHSDAIDLDFSKGNILRSTFDNIGTSGSGDAIDLSGSFVTVSKVAMTHIADKGFSIGESSKAHISHSSIKDAWIGLASKDNSEVHVNDSTISKSNSYAMLAYIKKKNYAPAKIVATKLKLQNNQQDMMVQNKSSIIYDGKKIATALLDVKTLY